MKLNIKAAGKKSNQEPKKAKKTKSSGDAAKDKRIEAMAKARAAAKAGGKKKGGKPNKPKTFSWKAPDTLGTSFTVEVSFVTEKDGMPGGRWKVRRIKGKYPTDDERKIFDMSVTDPVTYAAIISRVSLILFHPTGRLNSKGQSPRLEPKTQYRLILRCARRKKDDQIVARFNKAWVIGEGKKGKVVATELEKSDINRRKFMKMNKHLPAAFLRLAELPVTRKRRASDEDDDE